MWVQIHGVTRLTDDYIYKLELKYQKINYLDEIELCF